MLAPNPSPPRHPRIRTRRFNAQRYWILLPFWVLAALDHLVTVIGQSEVYWQGNYLEANEVNPFSLQLLFQHPLVFLAAFVAGYLVVAFIILSS